MEVTLRDKLQHRIVNEGLRLVSQCSVPQICYSGELDQLLQVEQERARSLLETLPPLLDFVELNRNALLGDDEECGSPATLQFQRCFVLVFLEQGGQGDLRVKEFHLNHRHGDGFALVERLLRFKRDVVRILTKGTNSSLRSSLFHYYESALGLQGWTCRSVELYTFNRLLDRLFRFLKDHPEDILFRQGLILFAVNLAKELLGFHQNLEHQKEGVDLMSTVMRLPDSERSYSVDAEKILKMALRLTRQLSNTYSINDDLWNIIYLSLCSIRDVDPSLDDEVMQHSLTILIEQITGKFPKLIDSSSFAYLNTLHLLLLLDVPEVEVKSFYSEEFTICGRQADWHELLCYSRNRLQNSNPDNLRFSMNTRIRIRQLIPRLFSRFYFKEYILFEYSNLRLDLLTWVAMFPIGQTEQQKLTVGLMLKRLLDKTKTLIKDLVEDSSHYMLGQRGVRHVYDILHDILNVVSLGINELPAALGQIRKFRWNLKTRLTAARVELKRLNRLVIEEDAVSDEEEEQDP